MRNPWIPVLALVAAVGGEPGHAAVPGQIVVDPSRPSWLVRQGSGPLFICGPGDPEGFLYRGTRNADGTRSGDQGALIDKLRATGANSIYMQIVRSHGGDGEADHNPFVGSDRAQGLDADILGQWETWFVAMDDAGIVIYLFFYDDGACVWGCSKSTDTTVPAEERSFLEGIVNRFEHHRNLIWVHAEEYSERFVAARASAFAAAVRAADDHDHVFAAHQLPGLTFDLASDPNVDQFAIQYGTGDDTAASLHQAMLTAWSNAAGRYNNNMSEIPFGGLGTTGAARPKLWAMAMGGAYVMANGWDIASTPVERLEECGWMVEFLEATNVNEMTPQDALRFADTQYVLARAGNAYVAYGSAVGTSMGLKGMVAGTYDLRWLNTATGARVDRIGVQVPDGDVAWTKPSDFGAEVALHVRRTGPPLPGEVPAPVENLFRTDRN